MGEQNQTNSLSDSQTPFHSQPQTVSPLPAQSYHDPDDPQQAHTTEELANALPQSASTPSKIPFRPRKMQKISPDSATDLNASGSSASRIAPSKASSRGNKAKSNSQRAIAVPRIAARSLSCDGEVENAVLHLRSADPLLGSLFEIYPPPTFDTYLSPFLALTRSILYQQLAFKAGNSIYTRFIALCGGEAGVMPDTVLALTPQQFRQIGVSGRKASYLHDLARKYMSGILSDSSILSMDDKSLFSMLTMVNGIGSWSVHMFMINSLHRPDVLPINDLQVRKGVQMLYNLEDLPRPSQMDQLCEKWRPYRSVASWYLWRFVEAKSAPVAVGVGMQLQHQEEQQQPQILDPINSILNLGTGSPSKAAMKVLLPNLASKNAANSAP